jgi:hypothetical protein
MGRVAPYCVSPLKVSWRNVQQGYQSIPRGVNEIAVENPPEKHKGKFTGRIVSTY